MRKVLWAGAMVLAPLCAIAAPGDPAFNEGDWSAYDGQNNVSVLTTDKSESTGLGLVCSKSTDICSWNIMGAPDACRPGHRTPILLLGEGVAAVGSEMACDIVDPEASSFELKDTDAITGLVTASEKVTVAIPTDSGFDLVEFKTRGFAKALVKAHRDKGTPAK